MDRERWRQIEDLYHAAAGRPPDEREAFLAAACAGDEELLREIETLLSFDLAPGRFLEGPSTSALTSGDLVSGYRVISKLGEGGMGEVYLAEDTRLGRRVALKVLPRELAGEAHSESQLVREARAASALDHPNIGAIYGIEQTASRQHCIVMAYYDGETLAQKLKGGPMTTSEAAGIALQIASGLAEAHAHGIVHRDVKPSNVFLTRQGLVKIIDFGIARADRSTTATRTAGIRGTPSYMAPEQVQGQTVDCRTDLWAFGAVLYEMITGHLPFGAGDLPGTLFEILHAAPRLDSSVPPAMQKIIFHALAKRPEDRYQSAAQMIGDLQQFAGTETGAPATPGVRVRLRTYRKLAASAPRKHSRRYYASVLGALLAVVAAGAALIYSILPAAKKPPPAKPAAYQFVLQARQLMQRPDKPENLNRAISVLDEATKTDPNSALAFATLGRAWWLKSLYSPDRSLLPTAESNARRALELDDSLAWGHIVMGAIQTSLGNFDVAQERFQRASRLEPSNAVLADGWARLHEAQGRMKQAEESYRRAAALQPESWEGHNSLAVFLGKNRRFGEAAEQLRQVVRLAPDSVAGHLNLGLALIHDRRLDEAESSIKRALECDPKNYSVHTALGELYLRKRQFAQAAEATERAIELNDKDWLVWSNLAAIYRWLGKGGRAVEAYKRARPLLEASVSARPLNAERQALLAEIYAYTGERDKSEARIRAAQELAPDDPKVLVSCANAHAALGDIGRAVELANNALSKGFKLADLDLDPEARRYRQDPRFKGASR